MISTGCYAQEYRNYDVQIPPAFELANIMVALTEFGQLDDNIVKKNTEYHSAVMSHFSAFTEHPAIEELNRLFSGNKSKDYLSYNYWRTGSYGATFKENRLLFDRQVSNNLFEKNRKLVEDFAKKSDFFSFYTAHEPLYTGYTKRYIQTVPIGEMWEWIESQFPDRYDGYKIIMSPLISGYHNTFKTYDFVKETVMVINVPRPIINNTEISDEDKANMIRTVLTEIDHNYVNPISDDWKREIRSALFNLNCWKSGALGYNSPYATFNEYMTWAVFSIYLKEKFDAETFNVVNKLQADFMADRRGFIKFREFNNYLLEQYLTKTQNEKIPDLYSDAIQWFEKQNCN